MDEKEIRNQITGLESVLNSYKEELDKITLAKEITELREIYELFKEDTYIKVERFDEPVTIYHIIDKQELKLSTALRRYCFTAHFDRSITIDRESKEFYISNYRKKRFLEYSSSPILIKDNFSVLPTNEVEQLINELTQSFFTA